jgi:hypothetical protein
MNPTERNILDTFLQYWELNKVNLIFMGYEEGVARSKKGW